MAYRYGNRDQQELFPKAIEEYVAEDDPVRAYDVFVEALDFNNLKITCKIRFKPAGYSVASQPPIPEQTSRLLKQRRNSQFYYQPKKRFILKNCRKSAIITFLQPT